jgi:signal transduction histidine kinase
MERRQISDSDVLDVSGRRSGVFRLMTPKMFARLEQDMKDASSRVESFRSQLGEGRDTRGDGDLGFRALQEIDTAHEELRAVEEELHAQADEIATARETLIRERVLYGELFSAAPEAYVVTDPNGLVLQANPRASVLFNLDTTFIVGKPLALLVAPADRAMFRDLLDAMSDAVLYTELRVRLRKEDLAWISLTAQRGVQHGTGPCIRWLMRGANVQKHEDARRDALEEEQRTRIYELEASQRMMSHLLEREQEARKEADERLQQKEQVLAEVAHELRGPLGTIAGWLHVLDEGNIELGVRKRALLSMTRGVRGLSRIVEELIDHARMERYKLTLDAQPINLVRVAVEVIEDLRPLAALKKISIQFSSKTYDVIVQGDPWRLQQVLRNLIGNSIKFTPEQGNIRVEIASVGQFAEVTVADSGRGIDPALLVKIFKPFEQVGAPGGQRTGLGLGLSIAQRLVELHGGTIDAHSDGPQRGSKFRVRLPLVSVSN